MLLAQTQWMAQLIYMGFARIIEQIGGSSADQVRVAGQGQQERPHTGGEASLVCVDLHIVFRSEARPEQPPTGPGRTTAFPTVAVGACIASASYSQLLSFQATS